MQAGYSRLGSALAPALPAITAFQPRRRRAPPPLPLPPPPPPPSSPSPPPPPPLRPPVAARGSAAPLPPARLAPPPLPRMNGTAARGPDGTPPAARPRRHAHAHGRAAAAERREGAAPAPLSLQGAPAPLRGGERGELAGHASCSTLKGRWLVGGGLKGAVNRVGPLAGGTSGKAADTLAPPPAGIAGLSHLSCTLQSSSTQEKCGRDSSTPIPLWP